MQENKFEKQVQEKMKELLLHPSDGVWQRIEAQIKKEKRRRWIIIFLPIPLIIFLFTGYRFWHLKDTSIQIPMQQLSDKYLSPGINPTQQKVKYVTIKNKASAVNNKNLFIPTNKGKSANKNVFLEPKIKISYKKNYNKNLESNISSEIKKENFTDADDTTKKLLNDAAHINTQMEEKNITKQIMFDSSKNIDSISKEVIADNNKNDEIIKELLPNLKSDSNRNFKNKNSWNFGLSFSAGISGVGNSFLGSQDKSLNAAQYSAIASSSNPSPVSSAIQPALALVTGVFTQKNISRKVIISIGLNYKIFSATNKVGADSAGYFLSANAINTYHNYYHFIELPVLFQFKISSKKIPMFFSAGVSISNLISSNAVQFNNATRYYYHDNSLFTKTQFGFSTGLSAEFFSKQKRSILIGPYIYYGSGKIANESLYKNEHFSFIGLSSKILFKKK